DGPNADPRRETRSRVPDTRENRQALVDLGHAFSRLGRGLCDRLRPPGGGAGMAPPVGGETPSRAPGPPTGGGETQREAAGPGPEDPLSPAPGQQPRAGMPQAEWQRIPTPVR